MNDKPHATLIQGCEEDLTPHWVVGFYGLACGTIFTEPIYSMEGAAYLADLFNDVAENGA